MNVDADSGSVERLLDAFDQLPCDRESIEQTRLDLADRLRTSLFPWRGQFSPELVELFLDQYGVEDAVVLDPFVGSGTTLFEAARKGLACYAAEINPAAVVMARTAHFTNIELSARHTIVRRAESTARAYIRPYNFGLFAEDNDLSPIRTPSGESIEAAFVPMLEEAKTDSLVHDLLTNAVIRYLNFRHHNGAKDFYRVLRDQIRVVEQLPYSRKVCRLFHIDARRIPLADASIDLIVTSPPYINVFNYHQYNRPIMEALGWNLLQVAKSEIGSNRKNRQNRFLTVVQYALDMADVCAEMRRLISPCGRAILVVGRESTVRNVTFRNGRLVAAIAAGTAGLMLDRRQERKFVNRFGETIYEDVLHFVPASDQPLQAERVARSVALQVLAEAKRSGQGVPYTEIDEAMERADSVDKSPLFSSERTNTVPLGWVR